MNSSTNFSGPYQQQWWGQDARLEVSTNADASLDSNQISAPGLHYEIPHEQHGTGHYPPAPPHSQGSQRGSRKARKRPGQSSDFRSEEVEVSPHRPLFSVRQESVASKDAQYEFKDSCHEFRAWSGPEAETLPQSTNAWENNSRTQGMPRQGRRYPREMEWDYRYPYEPQRNEFEDGNHGRTTYDTDQDEISDVLPCPYPECGNVFGGKNALRKHVKIHGVREFTCGECNSDFHTSRDLQRHRTAMHEVTQPKKSYICKVAGCDRGKHRPFSRRDNAMQHIKNVHSIGSRRVNDMIEEIVKPSLAQPSGTAEHGFRFGHRITGSSSTDDTVYSALSHESNSGYHSYEDPDDDIFTKFTHLDKYRDDLDIDCGSAINESQNWSHSQSRQEQEFDNSKYERNKISTSTRPSYRQKPKSEAQLRSSPHTNRDAFHYSQKSQRDAQREGTQRPQNYEGSYPYAEGSSIQYDYPMRLKVKEESPAPMMNMRPQGQSAQLQDRVRTVSAAKKQPNGHSFSDKGEGYYSKAADGTDALGDAFKKSLVISHRNR